MKITITGASGFIGRNLSSYLEDKNEVIEKISLRNNWADHFNPNVDAIIHLAGKAHDLENTSEESEYYAVNRDLTISLYNKFLKSDARDFFFFSSVKAVADTANEIITEDTVPLPKTPYGKSKLQAEEYLLNKQLPPHKRLFIIRPCMIHGPGNKGNFNLLFNVVKKGIPWPFAKFENSRSFLSIDNLCFLVYELLKNNNVPSGVYNFADDAPLSTNELIELINYSLGQKAKFLRVPKMMIKVLSIFGDLIKLPFNSEIVKKLTEDYVVSNQKIKDSLGAKLPIKSNEGILKTLNSFKNL